MALRPKRNITSINKNNRLFGNKVRKSYQRTILEKAPVFPKPLEYDDIDKAMFDFVDKILDMSIDGKLIPTYTLYSNQRFSEYSQMWEHSDEFGNLYLNFKTINRDKNPSFGSNQGNLWNIPGNRRYSIGQRDVIDEDGIESTEIYSMKQPYATDLSYTLNFITVTNDNLNKFNQKINKLFAARQCYIRPNGHFLPIILDNISDETSYSVSERKFFVQSISLKVMAYIIEKDDFQVKRYPKKINTIFESKVKKTQVEVEECENPMKNKSINVNISLQPFNNKVEFIFDTEMKVENIITENVRNIRVMVNDDLLYTDKGFKIHDNDNIRIKIVPIDYNKESFVQFVGYSPNEFFNTKLLDEKITKEDITID